MRVRVVHTRELAARAESVGELLDGLGGEQDRLWPSVERWPTTRLELERPLAVGASGRHDVIGYTVDAYEPGRRLVFRFAPGLGLVGTHGFAIEGLGADRCVLTHTLEGRVEPKLLALYPLLRRQHDALIEDILDQAELASTGRIAHPARWSLAVRVANGAEVALARLRGRLPAPVDAPADRPALDRLARLSAVAVPCSLAALAALHAAWALGWRWPGGDDRALADRVVGTGGELPPEPAIWAVALALAGAATIVGAAASGTQSRVLRLATWGIAGALSARGAISIPVDLIRGFDGTYERLDLVIYSPLCLALGIGTAALARRLHPTQAVQAGGDGRARRRLRPWRTARA